METHESLIKSRQTRKFKAKYVHSQWLRTKDHIENPRCVFPPRIGRKRTDLFSSSLPQHSFCSAWVRTGCRCDSNSTNQGDSLGSSDDEAGPSSLHCSCDREGPAPRLQSCAGWSSSCSRPDAAARGN
uniref:Uncharacterized protein n=1 Tax=Molossus molossus TaxID=27622 RepID=A0A7J8E2Z4_MOLMO|nr:hypothetical protein HJG59_009007 [Molossus molossus]